MMYQNQWNAAKVILRGKCIPINICLLQERKKVPNNFSLKGIGKRKKKKKKQSPKLIRNGNDKEKNVNK